MKYSNELQLQIREKPIAVQEQLKDFNWSIQIPTNDSKLPLKQAAELKGAGSRIDNCDELFSVDARNPTVLMNFAIKKGNDPASEDFCVRMTKGNIQSLFENFEILQEQLDQMG